MIDNIDLRSMNLPELEAFVVSMGLPKYRAGQIYARLNRERCDDFSAMSELPLELRGRLSEMCDISLPETVKRLRSRDGTVKLLLRLRDGNCVETVAMRYNHGMSVCLSSQAGCRMGCSFCASARAGFARSLTAGEILGQLYAAERETGERADSVVLMGIGEPLDNFDAVLRFYELVTDKRGAGLANRAVALSTCGVVPGILRLAQLRLQLTLSVSLHSADDKKRSELMPVNRRWGLGELLPACRRYAETTGRRVTFEYAVIRGENDSDDDLKKLAGLLRGMGAHVNLIPVNTVQGTGYGASRACAEEFCRGLRALSINATVRRTLGDDINAACGQLRRDYIDNN